MPVCISCSQSQGIDSPILIDRINSYFLINHIYEEKLFFSEKLIDQYWDTVLKIYRGISRIRVGTKFGDFKDSISPYSLVKYNKMGK